MAQNQPGYILRINSDEWVEQIFQLNKYYSGIMRNWRKGTTILFARKSTDGDSFLGYGIVEKVEMLWEMTPEEENYCIENKWKCALTLKPLVRFRDPLPIRETVMVDDRRRGSFLHGALLRMEQVEAILEAAERNQQ